MIPKKIFCVFAILMICSGITPAVWSADKTGTPPVPILAEDPQNHYLISSPQGLSVDVYQTQSQKMLFSIRFAEFTPDFSSVDALAVDGARLLAACAVTKKNATGMIYLFDLRTTKLRGVIARLPAAATSLSFSGNGRSLAVGAANRQGLLIYKIVHVRKSDSASAAALSGQEKEALKKLGYMENELLDPTLALHDRSINGQITALSYDDRETLAVAADDGSIRLYNADLKPIKTVNGKNGTRPSCVRFSPDHSKLAVGYADQPAIDVYKTSDLTYLYSPDTKDMASAFTTNLTWSTDSRFLYAAGPAPEKDETTIYRWRSGGEGGRSRIKTVDGKNSQIAPVLGGGLVYNDRTGGIDMLDKRYGAVYNEEWGNIWLAVGHKYGDVTYEIGGDYSNSNGDSGSYWFPLSRLKWPINAMMAGIDASVRPYKRLELNGSFYHNITNNFGGKMEDSDWMYDPDLYGDTPDIYSESDTDFKGYVFDGQARFWILDRHYSNNSSFALGMAAGFTYQNYNWEASNLDQWSPSGVYGTGHSYYSGLVVTYDYQLYMPYLEVAVKSKIGKIDLSGTIGGSPYLWAKDEDDHVLRKRLMTTDAHGYSVKAGIQANYNFTPNWFAGLRCNFLYLKAKGTQKGLQYETTSEADAGYRWEIEHDISSFQMDALLLAGYRF